jgi:hypothetical protein
MNLANPSILDFKKLLVSIVPMSMLCPFYALWPLEAIEFSQTDVIIANVSVSEDISWLKTAT